MSARYLHLVRMDVAHDLEPTFNAVYDSEHLPLLKAVPGVLRATRYRNASPTYPRYIAAYELESRDEPCRLPPSSFTSRSTITVGCGPTSPWLMIQSSRAGLSLQV